MLELTRPNLRIHARASRPARLLVGTPAALATLLGWTPPTAPNTCADTPAGACLWLAPDRWLLFGDGVVVTHSGSAAVLDAGARWSAFEIGGADAEDLLSAGCSLDLRESRFAAGTCAQTRIEQVPVILHRHAKHEIDVLVERPLAHHLELWLREAARDFQEL